MNQVLSSPMTEVLSNDLQVAAKAAYITKRAEIKEACKNDIAYNKNLWKGYCDALSLWQKTDGQERRPYLPCLKDVRYLHVLYSMFRGRTYPQIEPKVREHNELSQYDFVQIMKRFNVTEADIQWETLKWQ